MNNIRPSLPPLPGVDWTKRLNQNGSTFSSIWSFGEDDDIRIEDVDMWHECNQTMHDSDSQSKNDEVPSNQGDELIWIVKHTRDIHVSPPKRKYFALPAFQALKDPIQLQPQNDCDDDVWPPQEPPKTQKKRKANTIWWPGDWKCGRCGNHVNCMIFVWGLRFLHNLTRHHHRTFPTESNASGASLENVTRALMTSPHICGAPSCPRYPPLTPRLMY
ncbi:hypothetical protein, variant [Aphanomyces astaci]|uniref:Uncharacterized protein n=1 Tax=Aphanomyces astaci TaxID=112090 RepID=W4GWI2_APHAT|nr:hypothetical protein, variant [Aphanomyces astaci]ETV83273.1 hypothetical protein, variant [Aphanomyces astaci]|eukprot:XP_009826703.1 hypothetical protein, variant [Aphanomyces astaci]